MFNPTHTLTSLAALAAIFSGSVQAEETLEATLDPVVINPETVNRTPKAPAKPTTAPSITTRKKAATATLSSDRKTATPVTHQVITSESLHQSGYTDIVDALVHQAGFSFYRNGGRGTLSGLFLRGGGSDEVLVLLDGVPLTDYAAPSASAMLDGIDIDSVEKIEILKGAQSGVWGSDAVSGVVNIVTKAAAKTNGGSLDIGAGSNSAFDLGLYANRTGRHGHIGMSGHLYRTDGFSAKSPAEAEADGTEVGDVHLQATLRDDRHGSFGVFAHRIRSDYQYDVTDANDTDANGTSLMHMLGFRYGYNGDRVFAQAQASLTTIERTNDETYSAFRANSSAVRASASIGYRLDATQEIMLGADTAMVAADTLSHSAWGDFPTNGSYTDTALYLQYTKRFADLLGARTTLNGVVRYDHFDRFADKGTYRFGIRRDCNAFEGLHTSANLYSGYKAPSLYALSTATAPLKPVYTHGYDLTIGYKHLLEATYFHNTTVDRIQYDPTTFAPYNSDKADTVSGFELRSEVAIGETGLTLGGNYTHLFSLEDADGNRLARRAENVGNLFARYRMNRFTLGLTLHIEGERTDYVYDPMTFARTAVTLPAYKRADVHLGADLSSRLHLSFDVENIFATKYETVSGYSTGGRRFKAKLRYAF